MAKQYNQSPVQLCLALNDPVPTPITQTCNTYPIRLGQDQYRCADCGIVWDINEKRPPCPKTEQSREEN